MGDMDSYKIRLAETLAETGALFFDEGLVLKDGRSTPYFVNMGMFRTGRLSEVMGEIFAEMMVRQGLADQTDIILGPSYKGSAIALATAISLYRNHGIDLLFDYDRKEAKTHGEAGKGGSMLVNKTLFDGCRLFIVDDVATSMKTKVELIEKMEAEAGKLGIKLAWTGVGIAVDREQTTAVYDIDGCPILDAKGNDSIGSFTEKTGISVWKVAGIREIVEYIFKSNTPLLIDGEKKPMDEMTKLKFDEYLELYGVA
jgi:orotate phosphoribosyltransferase